MKKKSTLEISRNRAIDIAMNHNGVSREIAKGYTDSELLEVLKHMDKTHKYKIKIQ